MDAVKSKKVRFPNFFTPKPLIFLVSAKNSFGNIWKSKFSRIENKGKFRAHWRCNRAKARPWPVLQTLAWRAMSGRGAELFEAVEQGAWLARIFSRAAARANHAARSISGKDALRPLPGGQTISNVLLRTAPTSKSPSSAKASTRLPPRWRRISIPGWMGDKSWYSVIGVVADTKDQDLRAPVPPMFCMPLEQTEVPAGVTFEIRTASDAAAAAPTVLRVIAQVDGRLPLGGMRTLNDQMDDSLLQERLIASLASLFGVLAVLLACVGLYGLLAYRVNRKTNEIGIRMALGSPRVQIAGMILRQASLMVLAGLVVGIPAAMGVARLLRSQLYGLVPYDPMTILFAVSLMTAVASLASYLPARRAMRVDPMVALRHE